MRKALSIVLAGLLATLPVEQVLAQAEQQEARTPQTLVGPVAPVPILAPEKASPWQAFAEDPLVVSPVVDNEAVQQARTDLSDAWKRLRILLIIGIAVGIFFLVKSCAGDRTNCDVGPRG